MLMRMLGQLEDAEALYKQVLCLPVFCGDMQYWLYSLASPPLTL
jgi:hypothetical protein